jgi:hypothetical protein
MGNSSTALVEVLTAEVHALMVGSRQVTLSVYRQLDQVPHDHCVPFGRVRDAKDDPGEPYAVHVVGRHVTNGTLVRSYRRRVESNEILDSPLTTRWWKAPQKGDKRHQTHGQGNQQYAVIDRRADDTLCWYLFDAETRQSYRHYITYDWTFRDDETYAEAMRLAEVSFSDIRETRLLHAEWSTLPLIVLAGLR